MKRFILLCFVFPALIAGPCGMQAEAATLSPEAIQQAVQTQVMQDLKSQLPPAVWKTAQIQVQIPSLKSGRVLPDIPEGASIRLHVQTTLPTAYSDSFVARVQVEGNQQKRAEFGLPVRIQAVCPVWVVQSPVSAGHRIQAGDLTVNTMDVSRQLPYVILPGTALPEKVARMTLVPGSILETRKLSTPPDVRYNEPVQMVMQGAAGMVISVPGVALENGFVGDTIRVRQDRFQRKYYTGKIIEQHQVLIEL